MNNKLLKTLKVIFPYLILILFIFLIYDFYQKNVEDFNFLKNLKKIIILKILIFAFLYIVTEAFIFIRITRFFNKPVGFFESFGIMNATYLCNTFVQFSGLGFRAYYLKKKKEVSITAFIIFSLFTILTEVLIFSFLGLSAILIFDFFEDSFKINLYIKLILAIIFLSCLFIFCFFDKIYKILNKLLKFRKFKYMKNINIFFDNSKNKKLTKNLIKLIPIFFIQFVLITLVFYSAYPVFDKPNGLIFSMISSTLADFSFIFLLTPYSVGISEFFIYIGTINFEITFAEILFLMNTFRVAMLVFFFPIGVIYLLKFFKK